MCRRISFPLAIILSDEFIFEKLVAAIRGLIRIADRSKTSYGVPAWAEPRGARFIKGTLLGAKFSSGRTGGREAVTWESVPTRAGASTGPSSNSEILDEHDGVVGFVEDEFIHELP